MAPSRPPHQVVALAFDRLCTFEFGIVVELFGLARPELPVEWYRFTVCALDSGRLTATGGVRVEVNRGLGELRKADTIVIPGWRDPDEIPPPAVLTALRKAHDRGARLLSLCSGAFVLAAANLLDGKRATTHWRYVEKFRARYPRVGLEPDVLYVDEGRVLTSAGSAAGIDLCLHVIRCDYGAEIANQVARRLVVPPHRDGGQSQYVKEPVSPRPPPALARVMEWAEGRLDRPLALKDLAREANMSVRTLARRFVRETGSTPHRWLTHRRLLAAQRRLETTSDSIEEVAAAVGFETAMTLRHHFGRAFGTTPTRYRRHFALAGEPGGGPSCPRPHKPRFNSALKEGAV